MSWQWLWTEWLWPLVSRLWSLIQGSAGPSRPVVTDGNGIVNTRKVHDIKGKSFTMKTEGVSGPVRRSSEKVVSQTPQGYYTATDGGVICDEDISKLDIDGDINLSVTIKPSQPQ